MATINVNAYTSMAKYRITYLPVAMTDSRRIIYTDQPISHHESLVEALTLGHGKIVLVEPVYDTMIVIGEDDV